MVGDGAAAVHPAEIEAVLLGLDGVADCAVLPVGKGGALVACVEPLAGAALEAEGVRAALAEHLPEARRPGQVLIVADLPREDSGKVFKHVLRRRLEESLTPP